MNISLSEPDTSGWGPNLAAGPSLGSLGLLPISRGANCDMDHMWNSNGSIWFRVKWALGDLTWESLSNVNELMALDDYIILHEVHTVTFLHRHSAGTHPPEHPLSRSVRAPWAPGCHMLPVSDVPWHSTHVHQTWCGSNHVIRVWPGRQTMAGWHQGWTTTLRKVNMCKYPPIGSIIILPDDVYKSSKIMLPKEGLCL